MTETYAEQRNRILDAEPSLHAGTFDLITALGYEPESWDGMWKLAREPIVFRGLGIIILREIVYKPGTHHAKYIGMGKRARTKTRLVIRRNPLA